MRIRFAVIRRETIPRCSVGVYVCFEDERGLWLSNDTWNLVYFRLVWICVVSATLASPGVAALPF